MRTVEDRAGRRYLLEKHSAGSSRVRDLESGAVRHLPNETLRVVDGSDPLAAAVEAIPADRRREIHPPLAELPAGLLLLLAEEPRSARTLLEATSLCESDLFGAVAELRSAGLATETTLDGERGYALTGAGRDAIRRLQSASSEETVD